MPAPRFRDDDFTESGVDWRRIGSALNRYKWMIVAVTLAVTGAAAAATRFIHPTYSAQSTVWIDEGQHGNNANASGPIRPAQTFEPEAWLDLLRTYAVLDSVVHDLQLNVSFSSPADSLLVRGFGLKPDFRAGDYRLRISDDGRLYTLAERVRGQVDQGAVGDSIGRPLGFQWAPGQGALGARHDVSFSVGTLRDAARSLGESLQAHIDPDGNFLKIELDGTDPSRLTATLNDVTHRYVAIAADLRTRRLTQLTGILADQRDFAHKSLTSAEQSLASFEERTATLPGRAEAAGAAAAPATAAGTADPVSSGYFDSQRQLTQIQRERTELQRFAGGKGDQDLMVSELEQLPSVQKSSELTSTLKDLGAKQAELRALLYRYSDAYPAVQHLQGVIADIETTTIPPMINALVSDLQRKEADLSGTASKSAADLRAIPQRATDETRLKRNVTLAENLYNGLQARYDEAHVAEASTTPDVRVLDEAVMPQRPVKNTAPRIILLALVASFSLASIAAVLADKTDAKFRYPDQVSGEMGLTILGVLPHARGRHRDTNGLENAKLLEAFRAIRLNVTCAYGAAGPVVLTVTSPGSSEGKSFLTSHLGRVFADGGRRVLVVDGDLRRGTLHRRLGVIRKPGLADYLRGAASIDEIIQHTVHTRVDVITCGTRTHDAPELLGAQAMAQLLTAMRSRYDVILCDSPPLGAGVDPFVLGSATGNLLLVLRTGVSHRELTEAKLDVVSRLPIRLLGTVLNDVPDDPVFGYYSYYLPGYEAEDERGADREPTVLV